MSIQYAISGSTVDEIASSVESAIRSERYMPGQALPTVRALAEDLAGEPDNCRLFVQGAHEARDRDRRGEAGNACQAGATDLRAPADGGAEGDDRPPHWWSRPGASPATPGAPDIRRDRRRARIRNLYGEPAVLPALAAVAAERLRADEIDTSNIAVVGGALDGVERVLGAWLRPGDRVAVEDPGYTAVLDLLAALGLRAVPLALDEFGVLPERLEAALERGVAAAVLTPRAQNPTGAAWDTDRAQQLRAVLSRHPEVLVIEDDHAGPAAGAPLNSLCAGRRCWATIRSVSKWLGPDLRLAILAGDFTTVSRVEGRQALGTGWVSYLLQQLVTHLWSDPSVLRDLEATSAVYGSRRSALASALAQEGIATTAWSGLTMWVPVDR